EKSADPAAPADVVEQCDGYLARLLQKFPAEYSSLLVTDAEGNVRCSSAPASDGKTLGDRGIFKSVRDTRSFTVGSTIASRMTSSTVIPIGLPVLAGNRFMGMCALGISLKAFGDLGLSSSAEAVIVDRRGAPVGGKAMVSFTLPVAESIAGAIDAGRTSFMDYGQDGMPYQFHVLPLAGNALFTITAVPAGGGVPMLLHDWGVFFLILVAVAILLLVTWISADRWIVHPLRQIQAFAGKVAHGGNFTLTSPPSWSPEMVDIAKAINDVAAAIASREAELRSGLEQRDHMLREIHHRVKNNLQMISSLLNLQAGEIRSPRLRRFFGDAQNRVLTLSILHRHLYERSSWSLVDFQQFISDLVRQITVARPRAEQITPRYHIRAPIMAVGPDTAIPVGLIVTEAVTSALSHNFTGVATPEIRIEATEKDGEAELVIEDNGIDTHHGSIDPDLRAGFGVTLVRGLAMQLGGEVKITARDGGGMRISIVFPLEREEPADA
ncbi:MAG: hypothetical protein JSR47_15945, partial [Proteobacteria bacterium]|nr:hypothetical protein [Pseudomonadota bacterium]